MTRDELCRQINELTQQVVDDPRWEDQHDDLGVSVLGMILFGFSLAKGRIVMILEMEDINAAVFESLTTVVGAASKWSNGLIEEANASAFDESHHAGHFQLIGVGHSYLSVDDQAAIVDNIFQNLQSIRNRVFGS